ncbi:hypothetical protein BH11PSE2_BH11PSE2_09000 [soil metagenome]
MPKPNSLKGRPVLVTGGTGFIGARLVERLMEEGAKVTLAVRDPARAKRTAGLGVTLRQVDLTRPAEVAAVAAGQEVVFSLAYDIRRSGAANLKVHKTVAGACEAAGVQRFIHVGSIAAYDGWPTADLNEASPKDGPGHEYKIAKVAIEKDLAARKMAYVVIEPTIVYGPHSSQWTDLFLEAFRAGSVELPRQGIGQCNGVFIDDLADALILAAITPEAARGTFIVSGPAPFAWKDLIEGYGAMLGKGVDYVDAAPGEGGGSGDPMAIFASKPVQRVVGLVRDVVGADRVEALRRKVMSLRGAAGPAVFRPTAGNAALYAQGTCSIDKARAVLGYAPKVDLAEGLKRTGLYARERYGA